MAEDAAGREADVSEDAGEEEGREGADHVDFAVGEVQEADDAVHERVAEGYERVDAAAGEPPEEELDKILKVEVHILLQPSGRKEIWVKKGREVLPLPARRFT